MWLKLCLKIWSKYVYTSSDCSKFSHRTTYILAKLVHSYSCRWENVSCQFCFGFKRKGLSVISTGIFIFPLMYLQEDTSTRIRTGWSNLPFAVSIVKGPNPIRRAQDTFPLLRRKQTKVMVKQNYEPLSPCCSEVKVVIMSIFTEYEVLGLNANGNMSNWAYSQYMKCLVQTQIKYTNMSDPDQ